MLVCFELSLFVWVLLSVFLSVVFFFLHSRVSPGGKVYLRFSLKILLTTLWFLISGRGISLSEHLDDCVSYTNQATDISCGNRVPSV